MLERLPISFDSAPILAVISVPRSRLSIGVGFGLRLEFCPNGLGWHTLARTGGACHGDCNHESKIGVQPMHVGRIPRARLSRDYRIVRLGAQATQRSDFAIKTPAARALPALTHFMPMDQSGYGTPGFTIRIS